ncbi:iron-sulfur cluster repair di-iron protein [Christiangramia fulva]|uniref:Nitric oxide-dependent regulator DnrN or NorA n=2 Tax=Christiangramia TaxID=292691 RepID=A0A1L7I1U4_9FLAO|nr:MULTISPECIES: iron-sulfur cluster repair di-iron protein [Christiangramia]APU67105.1 Nitric oxide-dependent regulator DnrN or NorA [Christiangramia flava JLT2011]AVR47164.1 iron-sulfur cluster repair di-iron protein [Christiangramia fulva]OSS38124.1 Nitric oxide-dependent regulator DnrN or NorA [Christiangramia flava JLT2011]
MENLLETPVGQIVAEDYRTAQIFKNHKIDFCCQGNRSIREAAEKNKLDAHVLLNEIKTLQNIKTEERIDFQKWPMEQLIDYIEKKHHRYVEEQIPILKAYLEKLCKVHGDSHPELFQITDNFNQSGAELGAHMKKEELILFPIIKKMEQAKKSATKFEKVPMGTVQNPIQKMMDEHETEGERFRQIEALSDGYTPPADACNTYRVTYSLLHEFEEDLHQHIHLENNILFPKAAELEKELAN